MKKINLPNKYKCTGCMTCGDTCPQHCISFELMEDGHFMPIVDKTLCINCHKCEKVCPVLNKNKELSTTSSPFASWTLDNNLIEKSSSGGTFAQIAKDFILSGGLVAGAYISGLDVRHILIDDIKDLHLLQGSKYIQSITSGIYKEVFDKLKEGKRVLFSGTPCQIAGLYNLVPQKLCDNLFTIDLICHGVPSRKDLGLYLESHNQRIIKIVSFRDKSWKYGYAMTLIDEKGEKVQDENNYFYDSFNANKTLRWSCYNCPFKNGLQRQSDMTIGDFWGAKKYEEQKTKGLSLCIIHTMKGHSLLKNKNLYYEEIKWEECLKKNKDYFYPHNCFRYHPLRMLYPRILASCDFETIKTLYGKPENKVSFKYKPIFFINSIIQFIDSRLKQKAVDKILCEIKESEL